MPRMIRSRNPDESLARRAFGAIPDMRQSSCHEDVERVARALFGDIGLPHFALARFFSADKAPDVKVLAGKFEPNWASRYVSRKYAGSSVIAGRMLQTTDPYSWEEALDRSGVDAAQAEILGEAREFGLGGGLFTPMRWSQGGYAAVVLAGPQPDLSDPLVRSISEVASAYYFYETRRMLDQDVRQDVVLSPRQRECLVWVRHGKSSAAIGTILGISAQTVDEHIGEACRRLRVRTRTQAAVEASLCGLIPD